MRGRFLTLLMCPHAPQTLIISCPCRVRNICIQKLRILTAQIPFHFLPEVVAPLFHLPMYSASEWTPHCCCGDESGTVDFSPSHHDGEKIPKTISRLAPSSWFQLIGLVLQVVELVDCIDGLLVIRFPRLVYDVSHRSISISIS